MNSGVMLTPTLARWQVLRSRPAQLHTADNQRPVDNFIPQAPLIYEQVGARTVAGAISMAMLGATVQRRKRRQNVHRTAFPETRVEIQKSLKKREVLELEEIYDSLELPRRTRTLSKKTLIKRIMMKLEDLKQIFADAGSDHSGLGLVSEAKNKMEVGREFSLNTDYLRSRRIFGNVNDSETAGAGFYGFPSSLTGTVSMSLQVQKYEAVDSRRALSDLSVGETMLGTVKSISFADGLLVDVGTTVDALVPNNSCTLGVQLGDDIKVCVNYIFCTSDGVARRFPLMATLSDEENGKEDREEPKKWEDQSGALLLLRGVDPEALKQARYSNMQFPTGAEPSQHDLQCFPDTQPTGNLFDGAPPTLDILQQLPARKLPNNLLSLNLSGNLESVQVPVDYLTEESVCIDDEAVASWQNNASQELDLMSAELRCRDAFCRDLTQVWRDLLARRHPSIPVNLLGMTILSCGKRCLIPIVDTHCLEFRLREFEAPSELAAWREKEQKCHEMTWNGTQEHNQRDRDHDRTKLDQLSSCNVVQHARAVYQVEQEELLKMCRGSAVHDRCERTEQTLKKEVDKFRDQDKFREQDDSQKQLEKDHEALMLKKW